MKLFTLCFICSACFGQHQFEKINAANSQAVSVGAVPLNTVLPAVTGATNFGSVLTSTAGSWNPAGQSFTYQWYRGGSSIGGQTAATYTLTYADENSSITCRVVAVRNSITSNPATSNSVSAYSIANVTNLEAWYDVNNAANTTSAGNMQVIKDKSSKSRDMGTTEGSYPTYTASGGYNNLGYVTFSSGQTLKTSSFTPVSQPVHIYFVFKNPVFNSGSKFYSIAPTNGFVEQSVQTTGNCYTFNGGSKYSNQTNGVNTNWQFQVHHWESPNDFIQIKNEPYKQGHYNSQGQDGGTTMSQIGFFSGAFMNGAQVAEIIIVSGSLIAGSSDDTNIRAYLTGKYSVSESKWAGFFGDSITTGAINSDINANGYVTLLAQAKGYDYINISYPGSNVYPYSGSLGISGENLIDAYTRVSSGNTSFTPNGYFFFCYGTNDATQDATWAAQYQAIVQVFITAGVPANHIIIVSQPNNSSPTQQQNIATNLSCNFFHTYNYFVAHGGFGSNMNVDGLHPNATGHSNMATGLATYLP